MSGLGIMWGPASLETVAVGILGLVVIVGGIFYLCRRIRKNIKN